MGRVVPSFRTLTTLVGVGSVATAIYLSDARASGYEYGVLPLTRATFDGEESHKQAVKLMRFPFLNPSLPKNWLKNVDPNGLLRVTLFENSPNPKVKPLRLSTPVGVAAGLDKNGEAIDTLFQIGFSWVEVGSVTPLPQPGNPQPRVFRLPEDKAIINRYGFNSDGHAEVLARLKIRAAKGIVQKPGQVLALNLGKNKTGDEVQDYVRGVRTFGPYADALVVNVSSPNTPGLRDLQADDKLKSLLVRLVEERNKLKLDALPPLVVKIAPDLQEAQVKAMGLAIKESNVDGVIVGNTTITRDNLKNTVHNNEVGGLSGPPVKPLELKVLQTLRETVGPELTIIGCGGISNGKDALEFAQSGANFVQLYTSFAYRGPGTPSLVCEDLLKQLGSRSWKQVSGQIRQ
ncbi:Dihydroorotate dehydrogenase (quinone), mitochondrial [Wickerhamiella sorbophila]|uniref:Dihydroorotate dehydrogenase (quinone), mitochondrial n=1 Tax=Wickerhamiella sorbophila TaxID=45607 RepID=A0A2T0FPM8_9ASCO|nr:Dihydroorotate dehydrogenase (quinone), mitochondrial [Wickerhamiella sorbophila]PRT56942.1 Dihydroorotate dehydrogenase (quinone), mitochondrial [Wickerhamiella sorbophila]